jgi:cytoskeletal protein CcmA (bactofilin family)
LYEALRGREMADEADDLGVPMRPARTPAQPTIPARIAELSRSTTPGNEPNEVSGSALSTPRPAQAERRTMIVGYQVSLSGDIKSCDRLVVEGRVEATLHDCQEIEIGQAGMFKGNASTEQADVSGKFEGELVVSKRLLIRSTGHISGTITYGEIEIERGGKVSGTVNAHENRTLLL